MTVSSEIEQKITAVKKALRELDAVLDDEVAAGVFTAAQAELVRQRCFQLRTV